jgi:hypothetical protein
MHTDEVLYKISIIESSYQKLNYKVYNRIIHTNFDEFMHCYEKKLIQNANNLFKQRFLIHPDELLCKMSVVEYSY